MRKPGGEIEYLEDPDIDERMILIWIFKKKDGGININMDLQEEGWRHKMY